MHESSFQTPLTELLDGLDEGKPDARNQIISYCQERLRVRISQMLPGFPAVKRHENTSDVLQQVLLELSDTLLKLQPNDSRHFLSLAALQIRRTLIDLGRKYCDSAPSTVPAALLKEDEKCRAELANMDVDPAVLATWTEIHEYIAALPIQERELFDLIFYQGMSQEEAAKVLAVAPRTLRRHWLAARLRFMERFGDVILGL